MTDSEPHLVFQGAAWKSGLRTIGSLAFVAVGVLLWNSNYGSSLYSPEMTKITSIACIGAFGFSAALSFIKLCFPSKLILTPEGFTVRGLRKAVLIPWRDVLRFDVIELHGGSTMVGYVLRPGARDRRVTRFMIPGFDGTIAVFPEEKPIWVARVLDDWRRRYAPEP